MKNIPQIKIGIVAGTTDWLPMEIATENRQRLVEEYATRYGAQQIYECSIVLNDNEINIRRAMREITKAECDALVLYWANYGPESAGTQFAEEFDGPVMMIAAAEEGKNPYDRNRRDCRLFRHAYL